MATYICRPKADVSNSGWTINLALSLWGCLVSEDDGNSFIRTATPNAAYYALLDKPIVGSVSASTMYVRARDAQASATITYGTSTSTTQLDVDTYAVGFDWGQGSFSVTPTASEVNQSTFGCCIVTDATNPQDTRVSWTRLDLVYDQPSADGWAYLIGSFLGPLVAVGLHEMPGLVRRVNALAKSVPVGHPWSPHRLDVREAEAYWRSLREWRRPVYSV